MLGTKHRIVVIGGGGAGVLTATNLLRSSTPEQPVEVRLVERRQVMGPGLAYSTDHPRHLLNNFAARLSAFEDDPDHLLRWCTERSIPAQPQSFLPRQVYGHYLTNVLTQQAMASPGRLIRMRGEVVDVADTGAEYVVKLACGWHLPADHVVLALGNPPPRDPPWLDALGARYLADPWSPRLLADLSAADRMLLAGTGLTMVDVAMQIADAHPRTQMVAVSRHGLLPARHVARAPRGLDSFRPDTTSLSRMLRDVRGRVREVEEAGGDWRDVIDSLRPFADDIWTRLDAIDRERFVAHVARYWEVLRHRMAPEVADIIDQLLTDGRLRIVTPDAVNPAAFSRIVNCTGSAPVCTPGWSAVIDMLRARGALRPDPLGLGVDVDEHGALLDVDESPARGLYAVGAARRGAVWEAAAIPDIRRQAASLGHRLLGAPTFRSAVRGHSRSGRGTELAG